MQQHATVLAFLGSCCHAHNAGHFERSSADAEAETLGGLLWGGAPVGAGRVARRFKRRRSLPTFQASRQGNLEIDGACSADSLDLCARGVVVCRASYIPGDPRNPPCPCDQSYAPICTKDGRWFASKCQAQVRGGR